MSHLDYSTCLDAEYNSQSHKYTLLDYLNHITSSLALLSSIHYLLVAYCQAESRMSLRVLFALFQEEHQWQRTRALDKHTHTHRNECTHSQGGDESLAGRSVYWNRVVTVAPWEIMPQYFLNEQHNGMITEELNDLEMAATDGMNTLCCRAHSPTAMYAHPSSLIRPGFWTISKIHTHTLCNKISQSHVIF